MFCWPSDCFLSPFYCQLSAGTFASPCCPCPIFLPNYCYCYQVWVLYLTTGVTWNIFYLEEMWVSSTPPPPHAVCVCAFREMLTCGWYANEGMALRIPQGQNNLSVLTFLTSWSWRLKGLLWLTGAARVQLDMGGGFKWNICTHTSVSHCSHQWPVMVDNLVSKPHRWTHPREKSDFPKHTWWFKSFLIWLNASFSSHLCASCLCLVCDGCNGSFVFHDWLWGHSWQKWKQTTVCWSVSCFNSVSSPCYHLLLYSCLSG